MNTYSLKKRATLVDIIARSEHSRHDSSPRANFQLTGPLSRGEGRTVSRTAKAPFCLLILFYKKVYKMSKISVLGFHISSYKLPGKVHEKAVESKVNI